jgi:hypothetical protein
MPSKYDALAAHLRGRRESPHTMSFAAIEDLIGTPLPISSRTHKAWWGNDRSPASTHAQAKFGWLAAGWEVEAVDPDQQFVIFRT